MQATAPDRDDFQVTVADHNIPTDNGGAQDGFDLWLDLGGSD